MQILKKPKIFNKYVITDCAGDAIGYLQLVSYVKGEAQPHIEYKLLPRYWRKGIMSLELPKYLRMCKKQGHEQLVALVRGNNPASVRLLEKNGFVELSTVDGVVSYIADLKYNPEDLKEFMKEFRRLKGV